MSPAVESLHKLLDGFAAASVGAPVARMRVRCGVCGGDGWIETGFGEWNTGTGHRCTACFGTGYYEREVRQ